MTGNHVNKLVNGSILTGKHVCTIDFIFTTDTSNELLCQDRLGDLINPGRKEMGDKLTPEEGRWGEIKRGGRKRG